jgi:hypothetical protein
MRRAALLLIAIDVFFAPTAFAVQCDESLQPGFLPSQDTGLLYFIGVTPAMPTSTTPIRIDTGRISYFGGSIAAHVSGHEIDLVVTGAQNGIGIPPPLDCIATTIGPLPSGTYVLNTEFRDPAFPGSDSAPPVTITVVGGGIAPAPVALPAASSAALAALIGLLAALGFRAVRKRPGVRQRS